nr:immunoglobulin heavy chain junction region [Macaca mulatta]
CARRQLRLYFYGLDSW